MQEEANLFKVLSDPTRLRLVVFLALKGEVCPRHGRGARPAGDSVPGGKLGVETARNLGRHVAEVALDSVGRN